ncbi:MAG TPA: 2-hydroxyacid dehydrogenase [Candidatus Omnitrophota bacterium]|nr:2-hydroxyacid dehydrogenase [Candidatus Omnitrophota bacterium]HPS36915.1 2-hydroxyacid dehydrogenase [Candidatus Omnitrophota bacterium]
MKTDEVKVAFFDTKSYDPGFFDEANKELGFKITYFYNHLNLETAPLASGYDAVCVFVNDTVSEKILERFCRDKVRLIALRGAGYNNVDLHAAFGKMHVVRVPAYSPHAVAEHAVALMLTLNRKIHRAYYRTRDNNFTLDGLMGFDMHQKTAGIIGTGQIGKAAIEILKGFGMRVLAYDLFRDTSYQQRIGFDYVDLPTLYRESDIVSLHCPLSKETHHLIGEKAIAQMKPGVMLINTGRGMLIDSRALIDGLKTGKIGYAGLDVYEEESEYFFEDFSNAVMPDDVLARLLSFNNVLITSHQGFFTREALRNIAQTTLNNIREYFSNGNLPNEICYKCSVTPCPRLKSGQCFK